MCGYIGAYGREKIGERIYFERFSLDFSSGTKENILLISVYK